MANYIVVMIALLSLVFIYPHFSSALLRHWKKCLRQSTIQRTGRYEAGKLVNQFRSWADEGGYDPRLVDEVLDQHLPLIIERLGRKRANEILGEPQPYEA